MFEKILNPIFYPLLSLGYFWSILVLSFVLTLLITLIYKFTTDQALMKRLKDEMKTLQKEMKSFKDNPKKVMTHQKKIMQKNMQYMKHSLKPTLYTFIPIIIIFGWLNANLAFMPIAPDADFSVSAHFKQGTFGDVTLESDPALIFVSNETQPIRDGVASWTLRGDENKYSLKFSFENTDFFKELIISSGREYANSQEANPDKTSALTKVVIHNKELKPLGNISIFGWRPGWLGTYIVLSLIFSIALRKLLKIS